MAADQRSASKLADRGLISGAEEIGGGQLEHKAKELAQRLSAQRGAKFTRDLLSNLPRYEKLLDAAYRSFLQTSPEELALSYESEWLLDNYYIVQRTWRLLDEDLPPHFYSELPALVSDDDLRGYPRVYAIARAIVAEENGQLNTNDVYSFFEAYQEVQPLTIGELWAAPLMLRVVLLQNLALAAARLTELSIPDDLAAEGDTFDQWLSDSEIVSSVVPSLHWLSNQDWKEFFEGASHVERILGQDPASLYKQLEFNTRDQYRKVIEEMAWYSDASEVEIASEAVALASEAFNRAGGAQLNVGRWYGLKLPRHTHVGYYLVGEGRATLKRDFNYRPIRVDGAKRWVFRHPAFFYLGAILSVTVSLIVLLLQIGAGGDESPLEYVAIATIAIVPASALAIGLINWLVTRLVSPRILPKLDFSEGVPAASRTMVVIPGMLTSDDEVASLLRQIELHYLRNPDPNIGFALLTDWADADSEKLPEDAVLVAAARAGVDELNRRHPGRPFYLFHRRRLWNPKEGVWMGWERKRGKLHEFNRVLRGERDTSFVEQVGDRDFFRGVRYVITLDADTILPRASAARLIGTMAHPLNRAQVDDDGQVVAGYTILQPRTEIQPTSAVESLFTRVFAGDTGLDLYSRAVSNVYQDLFGEGIYVGKGIYDVDAFEKSLRCRVPENALLSHDLFEGILGRAGLVTDVILYEDFPPHYLIHVRRSHRWTRGDWQLLPWLLPVVPSNRGWIRSDLAVIDWWKMADNLRRSLLAPTLFLFFLAGWSIFPGSPWLWTSFGLLAPAASLLTAVVTTATQAIARRDETVSWRPARDAAIRWLLFIAFLPYETLLNADAILTTLQRLMTRRHLLQWTTAAHTARLFGPDVSANVTWRQMFSALALSVVAVLAIIIASPSALIAAAPLLLMWFLSPEIAFQVSRPDRRRPEEITDPQRKELRRIARRTWHFYERFVGPADNWLPPDHFQESPNGVVAHRTSPTNIGMYLLSVLCAYHFGYMGPLGLLLRLRPTFETLTKLEKYRGHLINWTDTRTLSALSPRYVSTVDSGNLAAALIALRQACLDIPHRPVLRWERWDGLLDALGILEEAVMAAEEPDGTITAMQEHLTGLRRKIAAAKKTPEKWSVLLVTLDEADREETDRLLLELVQSDVSHVDAETMRDWRLHVGTVHQHLTRMRREVEMLLPWLLWLEDPPGVFAEGSGLRWASDAWGRFQESMPAVPCLADLPGACQTVRVALEFLMGELRDNEGPVDDLDEAKAWCADLTDAVEASKATTHALLSGLRDISEQMERLASEMDFSFLYSKQRQVFHIGYNLDHGRLDGNYYDLLASEARTTSLVAIAKNDVPQSHWLHLARPVTLTESGRVLLSWSGTMFEYIMPPLLLRRYEGTLLNSSELNAVRHQVHYGREKRVPWGISESGYYAFDNARNYQYRAFGVPGLGFKRGLGEDLVVAPYASLMAVALAPDAVVENLKRLRRLGLLGRYGFYEAVDFERKQRSTNSAVQNNYKIVRSFMAHHQGMILVALLNYLEHDQIVNYFHSDPRIESAELLLQEQISEDTPLEFPHEDEVTGTRPAEAEVTSTPWRVPIHTPMPSAHMISNGRYRVLVTNSGGGYSRWGDIALTRWRCDVTQDNWGQWLYIQEEGSGQLWSAMPQPTAWQASLSDSANVEFAPHYAEFQRIGGKVAASARIIVVADEDVELRRVTLRNESDEERRLRLTSYAEVVLTGQQTDERHQAFSKLFVESEFLPDKNALLFHRRPRSSGERPVYLGYMLVLEEGLEPTGAHESDRARFIGRGRTIHDPVILEGDGWLTGTTGATLDPIMALGQHVRLAPRETKEFAFVTCVARTRRQVEELLGRYANWVTLDRNESKARVAAQRLLRRLSLESSDVENIQRLLSLLVYPHRARRAPGEVVARNKLGQPGLWSYGISGDFPILLVAIDDEANGAPLLELLRAHAYWRALGAEIDLVILNQKESNYGQELQGFIRRLLRQTEGERWLDKRGGIFVLRSDQMESDDRTLLHTVARVVLDAADGLLADQLGDIYRHQVELPAAEPSIDPASLPETASPIAYQDDLQFDNGYGGFDVVGREYVIYQRPGQRTPAPWINVIANRDFGFLVSETGAGYTWAVNSGENRLTPWRNDPVSDPPSEALYLRDEETVEVWSPTPQPSPGDAPYLVRHGAGYSVFEHGSHGLQQRVRVYAAPDSPVKLIELRLEDTSGRQRRITATFYAEWVLGVSREMQQHVVTEYVEEAHALFATNRYNHEFGERVAFAAASKRLHGVTADRTEFLGRLGSIRSPAALGRIGLNSRVAPALDPCAALQVHVDLAPDESQTICFLLGQGAGREEARSLVNRFRNASEREKAWRSVHKGWDELLNSVEVSTPDPALDLLLNRWLLYQTLSCRIWARSALYQSSGAYGFRDQLQDVMAIVHARPDLARQHILRAARHQFEQGDVLHWWHPPTGRGVRTRIKDDLLWLPYVTAYYARVTGDLSILEEKLPFLLGEPLDDEEERYGHFGQTEERYSLYEHCRRALRHGTTAGPHGLPLIGAGDWNDGMNRVGIEGEGESIWLGWFLHATLNAFAAVCERIDRTEHAMRYRARADQIREALEAVGWDGDWYLRAYYDDGTPLGSRQNDECQIDSIAQSWGVISGAADSQRAERAMASVEARLVKRDDDLILLFTPPFDETEKDPGYIKGYLPGIRENGGQYTHAALWTIWALAELGHGDTAVELYRMINPIYRSDRPEKAEHYRVEPYVVAADVYGVEPHTGRGGWTWYTGSSGWMYRLGVERILGLLREGDTLRIEPRIPRSWTHYQICYRYGSATYEIDVNNTEGVNAPESVSIILDGEPLDAAVIPLADDGRNHQVEVNLAVTRNDGDDVSDLAKEKRLPEQTD